jgi:hypothetical protein
MTYLAIAVHFAIRQGIEKMLMICQWSCLFIFSQAIKLNCY